MKQNAKTSCAVGQLEKVLRVFNQHCFKGKLPETNHQAEENAACLQPHHLHDCMELLIKVN